MEKKVCLIWFSTDFGLFLTERREQAMKFPTDSTGFPQILGKFSGNNCDGQKTGSNQERKDRGQSGTTAVVP